MSFTKYVQITVNESDTLQWLINLVSVGGPATFMQQSPTKALESLTQRTSQTTINPYRYLLMGRWIKEIGYGYLISTDGVHTFPFFKLISYCLAPPKFQTTTIEYALPPSKKNKASIRIYMCHYSWSKPYSPYQVDSNDVLRHVILNMQLQSPSSFQISFSSTKLVISDMQVQTSPLNTN